MPLVARLSLFYVAIYLVIGVSLPYVATFLRARGLSGAEIGAVLAAPLLLKPFTGAALAVWADGFRLRRSPMILLAIAAACAYLAMLVAPGFWGLLVCWLLGATLFSTISPLIDVVTLRRARMEDFNYGLPRGSGSSAFIAANLAMGLVLTWMGAEVIVVWITVAALLTAFAAFALVPAERVHDEGEAPAKRDRWKGLGSLLTDRVFVLAVVTAGLIQGAHGFYYSFSTILWRRQEIPEPMIGVLWGVGVAAEVGFMWFLEPWRRRVGPGRLLAMGAGAAVIRWTAYAFAPPLWVLFPLQMLHAFTFAASFLASLQLIERLTPPKSASAAQALNSAVSQGFTLGLATLASGPLFDALGVKGYWAMAALGAAGLAGALVLGRSARVKAGA